MQGGVIVGIMILLIVMAMNGTTLVGSLTSSSTPPAIENTHYTTMSYETSLSAPSYESSYQSPRLSNEEIEDRLAVLFREVDSLEAKLREQKLWEPESPYRGMASLSQGNVWEKDPDAEYLVLDATYSNSTDIPISDWYVESYVTEERTALPEGARLLESTWSRNDAPIFLAPGERAYLMTRDTPLNVSFHENICTGYLTSEISFSPSLYRQCPSPMSEMLDYGKIKLDNDACYDYVERLPYCTTIDTDDAIDAGVGSSCRRFIETHLNYNSCVKNHKHEPRFDNVGSWYIYLDRNEKLWRTEREIIRLMDGEDRVITVLKY